MLNTRKLIYLLPEVCFVAELSPSKKPHSFSIQSFRQINGQFMDDEEIVIENVTKLFKKLDPETYTLVLPDFLFTNTIIDVAETTEDGVREYLLKKLLPSLGLAKDTHQLETFILAQHQGKTKVQLSGLEKSILGPIHPIAEERQIVIDTICPLSWTLKSVISLEPSLSMVELGKHVYLAEHYIGIDQSVFFSSEELANLTESVRTLKGAEPNLQTLYLLTGSETEGYIKDHLKQQLPLQQLAGDETNIDGLPAHVKTAIEAAARTLDIEDYPVPKFVLEAYSAPEAAKTAAIFTEEVEEESVMEPSQAQELESRPFSLDAEPEEEAPKPKPRIIEESLGEEDDEEELAAVVAPAVAASAAKGAMVTTVVEEPELAEIEDTQFVDKEPDMTADRDASSETLNSDSLAWPASQLPEDEEEVDAMPARPVASNRDMSAVRQRPIIKNRTSTGSLYKMIGIMLISMVLMVAIGGGAGYAFLKMSERNAPVNQTLSPSTRPSPVLAQQTSPSPTASTSASAKPGASVKPGTSPAPVTATGKDVKVLVVNATGISGLAGKTKTALTSAGYKTVDTGNAKGKYEKGYFALSAADATDTATQVAKDAKLEVGETDVAKTVEDPTSKYDIVLVINQ